MINSRKFNITRRINLSNKIILTGFGILIGLGVYVFVNAGYIIETNLTNSAQIIEKIILKNFTNNITGLVLDGFNGKIMSSLYCDLSGANCKTVTSMGATGAKGDTGATGPQGIQGNTGASGTGASLWSLEGSVMFYTGGNVGIGTNNPEAKLTISGGTLRVNNYGNYSNLTDYYLSFSNITNGGTIGYGTSGDEFGLVGTSDDYIAVKDTDNKYYYGGVQGIVIASQDGNVGIGTNTPIAKLDVNGTGNFSGDLILTGAITRTMSFNKTGIIQSSGQSNQLVLSPNGNVGIGTDTPSVKLDVNGDVKAVAYYYSSDKRLKKNIFEIDNALDKVLSLNGYYFQRKSNNKNDIGVIAQEVEKIFPAIVHTDYNGYKSLEYGNLVAPIIQAIKEFYKQYVNGEAEQQKQIDAQQKQIEELKIQLDILQKNK